LVKLVYAAFLANTIEDAEHPVWLMIVGPPGSGKTRMVNWFEQTHIVKILSDMTPAALLSAYDKEASILNGMDGKTLIVTDMSSVLEGPPELVGKLFGSLRHAFDGRYRRATGRGTSEFEGKMGFMAACTSAIEQYQQFNSALGERFLYLKMRNQDEDAVLGRVMRGVRGNKAKSNEIISETARLAAEFKLKSSSLTSGLLRSIREAGKAIVRLRTGVARDRYTRELKAVPEIEVPTRVVQQLLYLCLVMKDLGSDNEELESMLFRLVHDAVPGIRLHILYELQKEPVMTMTELMQQLEIKSKGHMSRLLQDLQLIGVIYKNKNKQYSISDAVTRTALLLWGTNQ